jgi:hypothetical protein
MKVARLSTLRTGHLYPQEIFLVLISVKGWADPKAIEWLEGLCQWKIPMTPLGINPMTFRFVVQCLMPQPLHHHMPLFMYSATHFVWYQTSWKSIQWESSWHVHTNRHTHTQTHTQRDRQTRQDSKALCINRLMCPKNEITLHKLSSPYSTEWYF